VVFHPARTVAVEALSFEKALTSVSISSQQALTIFLEKEGYGPPKVEA
jgi:hypothetical protein